MSDELSPSMMQSLRQTLIANNAYSENGKFAEGLSVDPSEELAFRNVFLGTPDGPYVLKRILERTGVFRPSMDPLDLVQRNIGLEIAACCGLDEGVMMNSILNSKET